jgi:methionyl aminopeptidase
MKVTMECLELGIAQAVEGNRTGDIGFAVQQHAEASGYGVVRELTGHGVGRELHEAPEVPNYGRRGHGMKLTRGMVIAIEPMINMGSRRWCSTTTADGGHARWQAQRAYEHTLAIGRERRKSYRPSVTSRMC